VDIDIQAREILRLREIGNQILVRHTNQTVEKIERDVDRNFWLSANEAKEYGIIDEIFTKKK
jgi:ATP-dependent Clp protease, protease subunit